VFAELDRFVEQFMRDLNSPGLTLVLADREGVQRVATYGFGEVVNGKCMRLKYSGVDLWRVASA
jgi:hypothetical protein